MTEYAYKNCRFTKDGEPLFVIASDYQYYRDRREVWEDRLTKLKGLGVNVITFYTPWRHHLQFDNGRIWYDFTGKKFIPKNKIYITTAGPYFMNGRFQQCCMRTNSFRIVSYSDVDGLGDG